LGADLERDRLEHRIRRVTVAITALHQRASEHRAELGTIPRQLGQAIADFEAQIAAINARLRDLTPSSVHPAIEGSGPPRPLVALTGQRSLPRDSAARERGLWVHGTVPVGGHR